MEEWSEQVDYRVESLSKLSYVSVTQEFPILSVHGVGPACIAKAYIIWYKEERRLKKDQVINILKK